MSKRQIRTCNTSTRWIISLNSQLSAASFQHSAFNISPGFGSKLSADCRSLLALSTGFG